MPFKNSFQAFEQSERGRQDEIQRVAAMADLAATHLRDLANELPPERKPEFWKQLLHRLKPYWPGDAQPPRKLNAVPPVLLGPGGDYAQTWPASEDD